MHLIQARSGGAPPTEGLDLLTGGLKCLSMKTLYVILPINKMRGERQSGLYSLRQVTEVKLGRVRSHAGWVTSEA